MNYESLFMDAALGHSRRFHIRIYIHHLVVTNKKMFIVVPVSFFYKKIELANTTSCFATSENPLC
jgi:hypothetical protein